MEARKIITIEDCKALFDGLERSDAPAGPALLDAIARELDMRLDHGPRWYLSEYGYLAKGDIELYGANERQGLDSDIVRMTRSIRDGMPWTDGYAAIHHISDGRYAMFDRSGRVYIADYASPGFTSANATLLEYIYGLFAPGPS